MRDLEEDEDIEVVAAQTTNLLREAHAEPGELCLVTASSAEALSDHPLVGLWQQATGKVPQTGKTWIALAILAAVMVAGSLGLAAVELIAVTGAVLMVLTGVLTPRSAVRALNWNILAIIAASTGLNPVLLLIVVGTCISFTLLNPFSHQSNLMVMRPGGYSSATFVRFGIPLTAVSVLTAFGVGWPCCRCSRGRLRRPRADPG